MKFGSVCSGIEAASVAWNPLGWKAAWLSEIEPFPCAVLSHHYPDVPNMGDMTKFKDWNNDAIELLCGGTPCQSFSVAGLRKGLDDPRGNLMLTFGSIAAKYRPRWLVWENVPGVLSSNRGRDFGAFLGMLGQLGYGFAYRILDAQYFGVAQRRRRVFVIGYLGDWRPAAAVLFERHSLQRNTAPSKGKRQEVAGTITRSAFSGGASGRPEGAEGGHFQPVITFDRQSSGEYGTEPLASTISARDYKSASDLVTYGIPGNWIGRQPENGGNAVEPMHDVAPCLTKTDVHGVAHPIAFHPTQDPISSDDGTTHAMGCGSRGGQASIAVAQPMTFDMAQITNAHNRSKVSSELPCSTISSGSNMHLATSMAVRRLTPAECERLQGFPDRYTAIPWRNKTATDCPDGPRYKALGNSWAVPVVRWIGERIKQVDQIINK